MQCESAMALDHMDVTNDKIYDISFPTDEWLLWGPESNLLGIPIDETHHQPDNLPATQSVGPANLSTTVAKTVMLWDKPRGYATSNMNEQDRLSKFNYFVLSFSAGMPKRP